MGGERRQRFLQPVCLLRGLRRTKLRRKWRTASTGRGKRETGVFLAFFASSSRLLPCCCADARPLAVLLRHASIRKQGQYRGVSCGRAKHRKKRKGGRRGRKERRGRERSKNVLQIIQGEASPPRPCLQTPARRFHASSAFCAVDRGTTDCKGNRKLWKNRVRRAELEEEEYAHLKDALYMSLHYITHSYCAFGRRKSRSTRRGRNARKKREAQRF